ncbi:MAG: hypothetical protein ACI915_005355 [Gammaproteobacteria bacterium]|jgi:hypothetical protein
MLGRIFGICVLFALPILASAEVDEGEIGAWYMYLWNTSLPDSQFGFQGDVQHRNWDLGGDLEQLLVRGGLSWSPENSNSKYTFGYAHITSGVFGPSSSSTEENRIYQEASIPQRYGEKLFVTHRLRLEQRWVENQDFRNRFRYFLNLNYPLNRSDLGRGSVYVSFYNEIFLNLEKDIGNNRRVDIFDRNRTYLGLGYSLTDKARFQFGYMHQKTDNVDKGQLQFSLFHSF